jgi:hypothetical protein
MFKPPCLLGLQVAPTPMLFHRAARPFTPRIPRLVTCPGLWHRYMPESGNWHDGTFTRWIAALSAAPHPCYPGSPPIRSWQFSLRPVSQPSPNVHRVGNSTLNYEATSRFACAATRRFARLPEGAFVRELIASDYSSHLPLATWANCRTPTVGL